MTKFFLKENFMGWPQVQVYENPIYFAASLPPFVSFVRFCLPLKGLQKITKATKRKYTGSRFICWERQLFCEIVLDPWPTT
jgi:hypothetical protein